MFTGERVLGICLALRSRGLWKNAVVLSPTAGYGVLRAWSWPDICVSSCNLNQPARTIARITPCTCRAG
jgi:hypothetical protein